MQLSDFTPEDVRRGVEDAYDVIVAGKFTVDNPIAYILGGQGGAGKSTLHQLFTEVNQGNIVIINGDEYRRYHPRYKEIAYNTATKPLTTRRALLTSSPRPSLKSYQTRDIT